jgi:hypothetical protein
MWLCLGAIPKRPKTHRTVFQASKLEQVRPLAEDPAQLHLRPLFLVLVLWSCGFFVPMPVSCLVIAPG